MASEVSICNEALRHIRERRIDSLTDGSKNAVICNDLYPDARDQALEMHAWNFAATRKKLGQSSVTPAFEWDYQYILPGDFIRKIEVFDNDAGVNPMTQFALESHATDGRVLLASVTDIYLRYVRQEADPNRFSPLFRMCLALHLGSKLATAIANSNTRQAALEKSLTRALGMARGVDAIQGAPEEIPATAWETARY